MHASITARGKRIAPYIWGVRNMYKRSNGNKGLYINAFKSLRYRSEVRYTQFYRSIYSLLSLEHQLDTE